MDISGQKIFKKCTALGEIQLPCYNRYNFSPVSLTERAYLEVARQKGDLDDPTYVGPILFFPVEPFLTRSSTGGKCSPWLLGPVFSLDKASFHYGKFKV